MMNKLNRITKNFMLSEGKVPGLRSWVQALEENIKSLKPKSLSEERRLALMKYQIREIRNGSRRLLEEMKTLEEQLKILEEHRNEK